MRPGRECSVTVYLKHRGVTSVTLEPCSTPVVVTGATFKRHSAINTGSSWSSPIRSSRRSIRGIFPLASHGGGLLPKLVRPPHVEDEPLHDALLWADRLDDREDARISLRCSNSVR